MPHISRRIMVVALLLGMFLTPQVSHAGNREADEGRETVVTGWPTAADPEVSRLLDDLHDAKKAGDLEAALALEVELARLRGQSLEFQMSDGGLEPGVTVSYANGGQILEGERWTNDDIFLCGGPNGEIKPVIAGDSNGTLYAAREVSNSNSLAIFRSVNGGNDWELWLSMGSPTTDRGNLSMAVGEGDENWLLVAYQLETNDIWLLRIALDGSGVTDTPHVFDNPDGLSNPRIVTDSSEYDAWYAYMVFNVLTVEGWAVCFSRSLDHGQHWQAMPDIIGWHDSGYDASENRPDIDFGTQYLYATYNTPVYPHTDQDQEIFANRSTDYGATWDGAVRLITNDDKDYDPVIGAIKEYLTSRTVLIAYARFYHELDEDIWYIYSQDAGASWSSPLCMSCAAVDNELAPDLQTSLSQGAFHAAFHHDNMIDYRSAAYTAPGAWSLSAHINDGLNASSDYPWPAVGVNPTRPTEEEAAICWTDERDYATDLYDIYYDGPATAESGAPEPGAHGTNGLICCRPNPFTQTTRVRFDLPEPGRATLAVYDVTGRVVRTLTKGQRPAGRHTVSWDGLASDGTRVPPGVYFIKLETEQMVIRRNVTILR
ncbi:MAG: T9SS type A sorting domain-containing protein [Candidatus Eisenbacteria bacterium]|uniref:T9SS type A sorting domain-containing protein n=1 Tax=Eiseniibacteriota bacterium TaxID=2212470 RepID=A0A948W1Y7_UNCEI|nr:T9SS type A sorting domain-containing protein [Candidatus Eisenbacteria bacterium]MBU1949157.1 T9SS type A sorting domain-containing protein [Candidatus Eisenbacteria bacterium]MBU2689362.1 T9SS type A sorting domain-containing protein [Candidatus Eisenbacteria bacterium]